MYVVVAISLTQVMVVTADSTKLPQLVSRCKEFMSNTQPQVRNVASMRININ